MRLPAVVCLAWLLILVQGLDGTAQDPAKTTGVKKAAAKTTGVKKAAAKTTGAKKADAKTAAVKKADAKTTDVKKEAGEQKESGAEPETPPPGTESSPEDTSRGWFSNMIHSGATGLLIDGGWFMVPILLMGIVAAGVII